MGQITTHVLDTSIGKPGEGIKISLQKPTKDAWENITTGTTNSDGRIPDFMADDDIVEPGIYRMIFETKEYFDKQNIKGFYPVVPIVFEIFNTEHYHIPLLISPYGYSTYKGS